jgi:nucleosome binding factor SPN SPT16 subunit
LAFSVLIIAKHLETLVSKDGGVPLEIFKRTKDEEVNKKAFRDIIDAMKSSGVYLEDYIADRRKRSES